ncbi:ARM repeat-containing protein [Artomyces pyxidatus]|uniref:ARM repeat-containing protein n=1 Tax=Artomyces pyxidatus TaxID=48021 RepID=A0ACB8T052_9AGAM|nr:ARM repeat-containing protein [Artomyces pyxidatus]
MDVPFISSGALSSAHYTLVRNVELAQTPQQADQYLLEEVHSLRARMSRPRLSTKQCRECLILLMYCSMTATSGLAANDMEFALPHAVTLAEAGTSINERRIGYLFCSAVMSLDHEFRLMLVNTLRKDLEAPEAPRICLALDYLIQCPSEDVIPAIQSRLHDLVSHNSPHVRRRALFAIRALAGHDPSLLGWMSQEIAKRLRDSDPMVTSAAVVSCGILLQHNLLPSDTGIGIYKVLLRLSDTVIESSTARLVTQKILRLYCSLQPSSEVLQIVLKLIKRASSRPKLHLVLSDCFAVLHSVPPETVLSLGNTASVVTNIRHLLPSEDANEQYLFLSCLECVHPTLWAGTSPKIPAVLEAWEVERIMQLLSSPDGAIRTKTLRILSSIDPSIVNMYFSQQLEDVPSNHSQDKITFLLEVAEVMADKDGEQYSRSIRDIFNALSDEREGRRISESAVEKVLSYIRDGGDTFGPNAATTLLALVLDASDKLNSTLMVIVTALACEYAGRVAISPLQLLQGLSEKLKEYPASIQEVSLLAMMRLAADCEGVPTDVITAVHSLTDASGRHIQRRCQQFLDIISKPNVLKDVTSRSRSRSLPDFLASLESYQSRPSISPRLTPGSPRLAPGSPHPTPGSPRSSAGRTPLSGNKLRYAAYEPPPPAARARRPRSRTRTASRSRSATSLDYGDDIRPSSSLSGRSRHSEDLTRTVTAGELAVVAGSPELRSLSLVGSLFTLSNLIPEFLLKSSPPRPLISLRKTDSVDLLGSKLDLISLDSPFMSEPPTALEELDELDHDFESSWNSLDKFSARGWCEMSMDAVVRRLQGLQFKIVVLSSDQLPFQGELKVLLSSGSAKKVGRGYAAIRLRESTDEDGCLWRLRSDDEEMLTGVRRLFGD